MKVLFDQNAPRPLARYLLNHEVKRTAELGWGELTNGELIKSAESHGFECMVTADKNIRYQQSLVGRLLAIIVLPSGQWPNVEACLAAVIDAVDGAKPGSYTEIPPPVADAVRSKAPTP